jgi:hypothetical protein
MRGDLRWVKRERGPDDTPQIEGDSKCPELLSL